MSKCRQRLKICTPRAPVEANNISTLRSSEGEEIEMLQNDQDHLPNVPVQGWLVMKNRTDNDGAKGCSLYTGILDIEYRNNYWQIFKIVDHDNVVRSTYHLYGAYLGKISIL